MEKTEYLRRYKKELKRASGLTEDEAELYMEALEFEQASYLFEEDPEGAARKDMSYWEP